MENMLRRRRQFYYNNNYNNYFYHNYNPDYFYNSDIKYSSKDINGDIKAYQYHHQLQHEQQQQQQQQRQIYITEELPPSPPPSKIILKHPLQNAWTLWYLESDRTKSWEELQNDISSVDTVEDFWILHSNIKLASELKIGSDYSLFKKGIKPMWEDEANMKGGRWIITLAKQFRRTDLDDLWLNVLLCLIGEIFDPSDQICGAVVNIRAKADKISIWTADGSNEEAVFKIGYKLKELFNVGQIIYQLHHDVMFRQGSAIKPTYVI